MATLRACVGLYCSAVGKVWILIQSVAVKALCLLKLCALGDTSALCRATPLKVRRNIVVYPKDPLHSERSEE